MKKFLWLCLIPALSSCQNIRSKKKLKLQHPIGGKIYLLEYEIPAKWPFEEDLTTYYLTDSTHFRAFLGAYEQNSLPGCTWDYDSVHIHDLRVQGDSLAIIRKWGVDLLELRDKHKFD
jgi:hypothetical protein